MSWLERIQEDIIIITGDGKTYRPLYVYYNKATEWNFTEYNYPGVLGSRVDKQQPKGSRFDLRIIFQGEDHLDDAAEFEVSNRDRRPWTISHPLLGVSTVQCISLNQNVRDLAQSVFTGVCIETIEDDYPKAPENPEAAAEALLEEFGDISDEQFTDADFNTTDQILLQDNVQGAFAVGKDLIPDTSQFQQYFNFFNAASNAVLGATIAPLAAITQARALYTYPLQLIQTARERVDFLSRQFSTLFTEVENLGTFEQKQIFENNVGLTIGALCVSAITPKSSSDYTDATEVTQVQDILVDTFSQYLDRLGEIQADNALELGNYQPNFSTISKLYELVYLTYSKLTEIALEAKQERTIILPNATDLVNLTHQLYGLTESGENIQRLQENNTLSFDEIIELPKDKKIVYYV